MFFWTAMWYNLPELKVIAAFIYMLRGSNDMEKKVVFKYHPNVYDNDIIEHENGICQCCGKEVNEYCSTMYCIDNVHCICLECISDGKAAEKLRGGFIQDAESGLVSDPQKTEELSGLRDMQAGRVNTGWLIICG